MTLKTLRLMGRKKGMAQIFDPNGNAVVCTVIEAENNVISQLKTIATDGYNAVQSAFEEIKAKDERTVARRAGKPKEGHFKKAQLAPRRFLAETRVTDCAPYTIGQEITVEQFPEGTFVDIMGVSKGKGYQGVMKKYGFRGMASTHGAGPVHRHAGSTGQRTTPGRVFPGGKGASRMGGQRVTVQNLKVVAIDAEKGLLIVKGAVPGARNGLVYVQKAVKITSTKPK